MVKLTEYISVNEYISVKALLSAYCAVCLLWCFAGGNSLMVEYSLAKAEVEGSSPFFRLGFSLLSFVFSKSIFFVVQY